MKTLRILQDGNPIAVGQLPENWDEVDADKRRLLIKTAVTLPYPKNFHNIMLKYMCMDEKMIRQSDPHQLHALYEELQWIVTDPVLDPIFPSFYFRGKKYSFPKKHMVNATALEYALADEYYTAFVKDKTEESLLHMAAALVRPHDNKKPKRERIEDPRVKIHSRTQVEIAAKRFGRMPAEVIHSALLYFTGCKNWVHQTYGKFIFSETETESKDPFGWFGVFFTLGQTGSFGTVDDVAHQNFHLICQYLMKNKMDYDESKKYDKKQL